MNIRRPAWFYTFAVATIGALIPFAQHMATTHTALAQTAPAVPAVNSSTVQVPNFMQVHQTVQLRSTPAYGKNTVLTEASGTLLWVLGQGTYSWWHVMDQNGHVGYIVRNKTYAFAPDFAGAVSDTMDWNQTTRMLPPSTTVDPAIVPLASANASWAKKFAAVMFVAQSKLGTPYYHFHNEDRGQVGFDCSNFTAYVYHHALGISMSGASQVQYHSVGWTVPTWSMRPGDLIIFEKGAHVGIYVGNDQMIEEGGGLGKVGFLSVAPGSAWGDKITTVKRIF